MDRVFAHCWVWPNAPSEQLGFLMFLKPRAPCVIFSLRWGRYRRCPPKTYLRSYLNRRYEQADKTEKKLNLNAWALFLRPVWKHALPSQSHHPKKKYRIHSTNFNWDMNLSNIACRSLANKGLRNLKEKNYLCWLLICDALPCGGSIDCPCGTFRARCCNLYWSR